MSNNNLHIHDVTRVWIDSEEIKLDSGDGYSVYRVDIFSVNHLDEEQEFRVTIYGKIGEKGGQGVPFEFSKVEEDAQ